MLLLLALLVQDAKADFAAADARFSRHTWEARLDLGDWCKSHSLPEEAAAHFRFVRDRIAGTHPYKTRADKALSGTWKDKASTADEKTRAEHDKKCADYIRKAADLCFECYRIAKKGKLNDFIAPMLAKTLECDIDHPEARKERGEVKDETFGWVPEKTPWKVTASSKHFAIMTDGDNADAILQRLEKVHDTFYELFGERFAPLAKPMAVINLRDAKAFDDIRKSVPGAAAGANAAFYSHLTHIAYSSGSGALSHEVVHGLADLGGGAMKSMLFMSGRRADAPRDYWVIEGLACYVDALASGSKAPALSAEVKLDEFTKMTFTEFERDPIRNYAIAHAHFGAQAEGDKKKEFLDFVRGFYAGKIKR